jgi:hypothetical protein
MLIRKHILIYSRRWLWRPLQRFMSVHVLSLQQPERESTSGLAQTRLRLPAGHRTSSPARRERPYGGVGRRVAPRNRAGNSTETARRYAKVPFSYILLAFCMARGIESSAFQGTCCASVMLEFGWRSRGSEPKERGQSAEMIARIADHSKFEAESRMRAP